MKPVCSTKNAFESTRIVSANGTVLSLHFDHFPDILQESRFTEGNTIMKRNSIMLASMVLLIGGFTVSFSFAEEKAATKPTEKIPRPEKNAYVADCANFIDPMNEQEINAVLNALEEETGVKFYVVILPTLLETGYEDSTIEAVAEELMNQWDISPKTLDGKSWERGVLLLINKEGGKFNIRVETGKGWGTNLDKPALDVLHRDMFPYFNQEKYSLGINRGIQSLEAAIRMQVPLRKISLKIRTPKQDEFVVDAANLLPIDLNIPANQACQRLYQDFGLPMFIVTIPSIEDVARKGLNAETVAKRFFLFWPIDPEARCKAFRNHGALVLLSRKDNTLSVLIEGTWKTAKIRKELQTKLISQLASAIQAHKMSQGILDCIQAVGRAIQEGKLPNLNAPKSDSPLDDAAPPDDAAPLE